MDVTGSVGLDLSVASHVFLMEPLADRSLESQIVSRANRMGTSTTTQVETFVMKGSAEELLLEFYQQSGGRGGCSWTTTRPLVTGNCWTCYFMDCVKAWHVTSAFGDQIRVMGMLESKHPSVQLVNRLIGGVNCMLACPCSSRPFLCHSFFCLSSVVNVLVECTRKKGDKKERYGSAAMCQGMEKDSILVLPM